MAQRGRPRKVPPEAAVEELNPEHADTAEVAFPQDNTSAQLTPEFMLQVMAQMGEQNRAALIEAIRELKAPTAEEQAKTDAERQRRMNNARQTALATQKGEQALKTKQKYCRHAIPDGHTAFRTQVFSDGCFVAFCPQCKYESPRILAPEHNRRGEAMDFYKLKAEDLTIEKLEAMARNSPPPMPVQTIPAGMEVDLGGM